MLFLGVTILLASTYTTLYSQVQRVPDTVDSVVKVAEPQPIKPVEKDVIDNSMGAGDAPNVQPNKNIKDGMLSFIHTCYVQQLSHEILKSS